MIVTSTKHSAVAGALQNLTGIVSVQAVVDTINQISNFKEKTLKGIPEAEPFHPDTNPVLLKLLYIDVTYQRRLRLKKLINKIIKQGGFNKDAAGSIDLAMRPDGSLFVWDGFRRCIKAGLCGLESIRASQLTHPGNFSEEQCQEVEARLFKIRSAESDKVTPEELFKCDVVSKEPYALELLKLLKEAKLDIEGLNEDPRAIVLGGFRMLRDEFQWGNIDNDKLIEASDIIQKIKWKNSTTTLDGLNHPNISVVLLCGLHYLLRKNEEYSNSLGVDEEIYLPLKRYVEKHGCSQKYFTEDRLTSKQIKSAMNGSSSFLPS